MGLDCLARIPWNVKPTRQKNEDRRSPDVHDGSPLILRRTRVADVVHADATQATELAIA
jgi:hypothetical protein